MPAIRLIVVARMVAPNTYDIRQCRRATARISEVETSVLRDLVGHAQVVAEVEEVDVARRFTVLKSIPPPPGVR
ncbi:hypothetical protein SCALM49S_08428 [Streptomyces californicus]